MHHELLHLDFVADSNDNMPNPKVSDLTIDWKEWDEGDGKDKKPRIVTKTGKAYGPERCKLVARLDSKKLNGNPAGYYVQRNGKYPSTFEAGP